MATPEASVHADKVLKDEGEQEDIERADTHPRKAMAGVSANGYGY